jgi:prolipoprotein diacylglyceryltransferase
VITAPLWLSIPMFALGVACIVWALRQPDSEEERTKEPAP